MARAPRSRGQGGRITKSTATLPRLDGHVEFDFGYDFVYTSHAVNYLHGPTRTELTIARALSLPNANEMSSSSSSSGSSRSTPAVSKLKRKRDPSSDSSSSSETGQTDSEDVPVLSHAAKRKERKAVLQKALATKSPAKKEKKEELASRPPKRENSIWVGNLPYKTTPESLRRFFDGVGEITRVHLPTKLGKASPGGPARRENRGWVWFRCFSFLVSVLFLTLS